MNIPQVPKDITDAKQMQDYMTGIQKALTQKEIDDAKLSEDTKKLIPSVPSIASSAEAIAGTDDTKIITPLKLRNGLNASGSAPIYACRAWVNFNGIGTVAIRASGNVSSITDNGMGNYTVNFTTAMPDANYSMASTIRHNITNHKKMSTVTISTTSVPTTNDISINCGYGDDNANVYIYQDCDYVCVSIFR